MILYIKKDKLNLLYVVSAFIFFVIIRAGLFINTYESRGTIIEPDDSFAYLLKAQLLFSDPLNQSKSMSSLKSSLEEKDPNIYYNKLINLRVFSRYHVGWSLIVRIVHEITSFDYTMIWWILLFSGQILLIIGFYSVLYTMNLSYSLRSISIILFTLVLYKVEHTNTMAPREWAFVAFLYLIPIIFSFNTDKRFSPFDAFAIMLISITGILSHPRFFMLLPLLGLFIIIYYYKRIIKRDISIIMLVVFLVITPIVLIIINSISTVYGFPFLGFSAGFSIINNLNTINFSTFLTNLLPAAIMITKLLGYISFFYIDAMILITVGIIISIKNYKMFFCFFISLCICSIGLLFLYFPNFPAQYFFMYNSAFAFVFVIYEAIGLYCIAYYFTKKMSSLYLVVPGFLTFLIIFQYSLVESKGFDIINRNNISNPMDIITKVNNSFVGRSIVFVNQIPLYAYILEGKYDRRIDISTIKDISKSDNNDDLIVGFYGLPRTPKGFLIKNAEHISIRFETSQNFKDFSLSLESDNPDNVFFEFIDNSSVVTYSFSELNNHRDIEFKTLKILYSGEGSTYLKKFTNMSEKEESFLPVSIPYLIDYKFQNRIVSNWRTKIIIRLGLVTTKQNQGMIHRQFNTKVDENLSLKILFNDGVFFIAERI